MGELLYLRGLQIAMQIKTVSHSGKYEEVRVKAGSFGTFQFAREWYSNFLDHFQLQMKREKKIAGCAFPSSKVEAFDPSSSLLIKAEDPEIVAKYVLQMLLTPPSLAFNKTEGLFVWKANVRMRLTENSVPHTATIVCQAFASREEIPSWRAAFEEEFRQQAFGRKVFAYRFKNQKVLPRSGNTLQREDYSLCADLEPKEQGKEFFWFMLRHSIAPCRARR